MWADVGAAYLTQSPDAIIALDLDGVYRVFNPAAERLSGYPAGEVLGRRFLETRLLDRVSVVRLVRAYREAVDGSNPGPLEVTVICQDRSTRTMEGLLGLLRSEDRVVGIHLTLRDVTARRHAEESLRARERQYRQMFDQNRAIKLLLDPATGRIVDVNQAACQFYGYPRERLLGMSIQQINTLSTEEVTEELDRALREERDYFLFRHRLASGEERDVEVHSAPVETEGGTLLYSIIHDITARRRAEESLRESEARFRAIFEAAPIGIELADKSGRLIATNAALQQMLGYSADELRDIDFASITHPDDVAAENALDDELVSGRRATYQLEKRHLHKEGHVIWTRLTATIARNEHGEAQFALGMVEDITDRKRAEEALAHQALHDTLTGLPNRVLLYDRLEQALCAGRRGGTPVALLLMDLNRFKEINDTFGHHFGDLVLEQVGKRLQHVLRQSDTIARLGGDEFAIVLPDTGEQGAVHAAEKLVAALVEPFIVHGHALQVEASVGIALAPDHSDDRTTLLRQSDVAMYVAKHAGNSCAVYRPEDDVHTPGRLALVGDLRRAIEAGDIFLHYQPKLDLGSHRVTGVEALVRWRHPERGLVPPDEFIHLAESTGLIRPLTVRVLNEALSQCRAWHDAGIDISVAVNLSPRTLQDRALVEIVQEHLARWDADPRWLELEITESAIMADAERALETLIRLHDMGIGISIDDFGTGYSSLAYLKNLPVDEIKIDKSFILGMARNEDDAFIPQSVIDLGHNLGMQVVAEGVETQRILDRLAAMGCDLAQGYHLSRPLPAEEIERWLTGGLARTA